jgi:hypothetical protein
MGTSAVAVGESFDSCVMEAPFSMCLRGLYHGFKKKKHPNQALVCWAFLVRILSPGWSKSFVGVVVLSNDTVRVIKDQPYTLAGVSAGVEFKYTLAQKLAHTLGSHTVIGRLNAHCFAFPYDLGRLRIRTKPGL